SGISACVDVQVFVDVVAANRRFSLTKIPGHTSTALRVGIRPSDRALVAGVHACAALDAILKLEEDSPILVKLIAFGRTYVCRAMVWADRVANARIDENVRLRLTPALIAIRYQAEAFGRAQLLHREREALYPNFASDQNDV